MSGDRKTFGLKSKTKGSTADLVWGGGVVKVSAPGRMVTNWESGQ